MDSLWLWESVCAIKCDKYYCFCFAVRMKREKKASKKAKSTKWVSNERDLCVVQPSKNAKCKEGRLLDAIFLYLTLMLCVEHAKSYINEHLKHKNEPQRCKRNWLFFWIPLSFSLSHCHSSSSFYRSDCIQ